MKKRSSTPLKPVPRYLIPGCGKSGAPGLNKKAQAQSYASTDDQGLLIRNVQIELTMGKTRMEGELESRLSH